MKPVSTIKIRIQKFKALKETAIGEWDDKDFWVVRWDDGNVTRSFNTPDKRKVFKMLKEEITL